MWLRWLLQLHLITKPETQKGTNYVNFDDSRNTNNCTSSRILIASPCCCFFSHETKELQFGKHVHLGRQLHHFSGSSYLLLRPTGNHSSMDCGCEYCLLWSLLERPTEIKTTYLSPHRSYNDRYYHYGIIHFALTQKKDHLILFYFLNTLCGLAPLIPPN